MEENFSDTEQISKLSFKLSHSIVATKRQEKFQRRVITLRSLILILLAFGTALCNLNLYITLHTSHFRLYHLEQLFK